jgi:hypothetical protein
VLSIVQEKDVVSGGKEPFPSVIGQVFPPSSDNKMPTVDIWEVSLTRHIMATV